jgi:hypothetical protein
LRDKSSAVGRAAGGWFRSSICDGSQNSRAAVSGKFHLFSMIGATALAQMGLNAVTLGTGAHV